MPTALVLERVARQSVMIRGGGHSLPSTSGAAAVAAEDAVHGDVVEPAMYLLDRHGWCDPSFEQQTGLIAQAGSVVSAGAPGDPGKAGAGGSSRVAPLS